jgi:hypothetical protein
VAKKVSALNTATFFTERATLDKPSKFNAILARVGNNPPLKGDEKLLMTMPCAPYSSRL